MSSTAGRRSCSTALQKLPQLRDVASDQQTNSTHAVAGHRSRSGGALRHPALADRPDALRRLRPAPGDAVLHAAQQLSRDPRDHAGAAGGSRTRCSKLYVKSPLTGQHGAAVDLRASSTPSTSTYLSINHQGQFPAVTLSFNLAPGVALGRGGRCDPEGRGRHAHARDDHRHLPGHGAGLPGLAEERAVSDPGGARGRVHHSRHAVRELHPSADDSLDAALGGRRGAADADGCSTSTCR